MRLKFVPLVLLVLSSPAFAWDCSKWISTVPGTECYRKLPDTGGKANATSKSKSKSVSKATSTATSESSSQANNAGVTTTFDDHSSVSVPRQTPPAFAGDVQPTTSCANARNGGASSPIAGLSVGFSTKDKECDLRETARLFWEMGQRETAVLLLCQSESAKKLGNRCAFKETQTDDGYYHWLLDKERERRIHEHRAEDLSK